MSINLQKCLRERRQFGTGPSTKHYLDDQVYSDSFIMSQMSLDKELTGHVGCVNTLAWSLLGDKLLSGSDDTKLNIYLPFEDYEISTVIDTCHEANIFTAQFMPQTSDNVIISGAGDSEIRIFDLKNMDSSMYVCHGDQVKKICVYDDFPNEFLSCSQDGTVRQFDLRIPHICSPHNIRSFITAQNKPARQQFPLPKGSFGCSNPIVDYSRFNIELNTMAINKLFPHYFAVAGMNDYIYLHDRRMTMPSSGSGSSSSSSSSSSGGTIQDALKCVKRFSPTLDGYSRPNQYITACKFSDTNGNELIGSWSSDGIYLFNINDSPDSSSNSSNSSGLKRRNTATTATTIVDDDYTTTITIKSLWKKVVYYYARNDLSNALLYCNQIYQYSESTTQQEDELYKCCVYMIHASILLSTQTYELTTTTTTIQDLILKAETIILPHHNTLLWQGIWSMAIGYWLLSLINCPNNELYLDKSLKYAQQVKITFQHESFSPTTSSSTATNFSSFNNHRVYISMVDEFLNDLEGNISLNRYKWVHSMNVNQSTLNEFSSGLGVSSSFHNDDVVDDEQDTTSAQDNDSNNYDDIYNDNDDDQQDEPPPLNIGGVVKPRLKYTGHLNIETIKDVDFYGSHDEYIVSGSDKGYLFIWDKNSTKIVQILKADGQVVNVAKGHPFLPILAVSGIDSTVKIFKPISRPSISSKLLEPNNPNSYSTSSRLYEQEEIIILLRDYDGRNSSGGSSSGSGSQVY